MKKFLQYVGVTLGFVTMSVFAVGQIYVWSNYGLIWGLLMWLPFVGTMYLLGKIFPYD